MATGSVGCSVIAALRRRLPLGTAALFDPQEPEHPMMTYSTPEGDHVLYGVTAEHRYLHPAR